MIWYPNVPYDPVYPKLFASEKRRLIKAIRHADIEHVGSTAVPGMSGKGYIDIYVTVKCKLYETSKFIQEKLGYDYKEHASIPDERLFHLKRTMDKKGTERVYHLHLAYKNSQDYKNCILFRDYLKNNPQDAKKYADAKKLASKKANKAKMKTEAKAIYMDTKRHVLEEILRKMRK